MKNYLTFRQLDSGLIHKAKLNESDIEPGLRVLYINDKLMKVYRLLDGLNDPWYHKTTTPVAGSDVVRIQDTGGDTTLSSVDQVNKLMTRAAGAFAVGDLLTAVFYNSANGNRVCDFVARVTAIASAGAQATYTVLDGSDSGMTLTGTRYTVIVPKGASTNSLDISSLYVKDILRLFDNAYTGGKERLFSQINDPKIFAVLHRDPFYDSRVAYFQRGDTILLYVGSSATALGTITLDYRGKPTPCTDFDSDVYVDIPPEDNQVLMDEVLAEYLTHVGKPIPADVANRQIEFQKRYDAAMADVQKQQAMVRGVRSNP